MNFYQVKDQYNKELLFQKKIYNNELRIQEPKL